MRGLIWLTLLLPIPALAANPQVEMNSLAIEKLKVEQVIQNSRINALELTDPVPGPAGPVGPPGADGADGIDGVDGVDGMDGMDGAQGAVGPQGPPGGAPAGVSTAAAQIQTALDLTSGLRWLYADHYRKNGSYAMDNATAGAEPPGAWSNQYVEQAQVTFAGIEIIFRDSAAAEIANSRVYLLPNDPGSSVIWFDCVGDGINDAYLAELQCTFSDPPHEPVYSIRRQIETGNDLVDQVDAKQLVEDFYNQNGIWPMDNTQIGLGPAFEYQNPYVFQLEVIGPGLITIWFGDNAHPELQFQTLTWIPLDNGSLIQWECYSGIESRYLPAECHN